MDNLHFRYVGNEMYVDILYYSGGQCPGYLRDWLTDKINSNLRTSFVSRLTSVRVLARHEKTLWLYLEK